MTRLIRAKLMGSDFSESIGVETKLRGAILRLANMSEAQFFCSDFSAAQLVAADLKRAKFFRCKFDKTHLYSADIIGTDFVQCRPWEALLFFSPNPIGIDPDKRCHTSGIGDSSNLL